MGGMLALLSTAVNDASGAGTSPKEPTGFRIYDSEGYAQEPPEWCF